jgi:hypothetical protein
MSGLSVGVQVDLMSSLSRSALVAVTYSAS